ncbi:T9SS type A sorting domain-containing protein [bacterium]|nr:T9SS type A sorting domain-containing protein [bacterium]
MQRQIFHLLLAFLLLPALLLADDPLNVSLVDRSIHRWSWFNIPSLDDNLLCANTNWDEITLFDLSQPDSFRESYVWFDYETSLAVIQDGLLFMGWGDTLVSIYSLENPSHPIKITSILQDDYSGVALDATRIGDVLFVAEENNIVDAPWDESTGLRWYDISNLDQIQQIGFIPMTPCSDLTRAGNLLLVEDQGLALDVSNPFQPDSVNFDRASVQLLFDTLAVSWSFDSVFVSGINQETFELTRLGSCAKPVPFNSIDQGCFNGSTLLLQRRWDYLTFFDLSNPAEPVHASTYTIPTGHPQPLLGDEFCITYERNNGLRRLDIHDLDAITETAFMNRFGEFEDILLVDDKLYALISDLGIAVYDVSDPEAPSQLHFFPIDGWLQRSLSFADGSLYVSVHDYQAKIQRYDILPDGTLEETAEIDMEYGSPFLIEVVGDTLYCISNRGITLYDLGDPDDPSIIWMQSLFHQYLDLRAASIVGDWIYLNSDQFGIMRKSRYTADNPEVIIPLDSDHGHAMTVRDNAIFLNRDGILECYSRPEGGEPELLDELNSPYLFDSSPMIVRGDHLFMPQGYHGLTIVNARNRFRLQVSGYYPTPEYPADLVRDGNFLYTMSGEWVGIYEISAATDVRESDPSGTPSTFSLETAYPNPFNPTVHVVVAVPHVASLNAEVFDLLGRRVATLSKDRPFQPGYHTLSWTPQGSSGVYFVRLEAGNEWQAMRKVVFVK